MYSSFQLIKKYFRYYRKASGGKGHGVHSPFVFDFILNVLNNKSNYQAPVEIEQLRHHLLKDKRALQIEDFGAGSRVRSGRQKTVAGVAKSALKPKSLSQLLFRLVKHYQPKIILELGTSLGITTSYFSKASPQTSIITIEGSSSIASVARENFQQLHCSNIQLNEGNFDDLLPSVIHQLSFVDLAYIDGNHRYQPTISYFRQLVSACNQHTVLVFDDIHWSAEMEQAWEEIKLHPQVKCTIDIFFLGFVFFREEFREKQHFSIRF